MSANGITNGTTEHSDDTSEDHDTRQVTTRTMTAVVQPVFSQEVSILVFRGQPIDTQRRRSAKICITFDGDDESNMTFELARVPWLHIVTHMDAGAPQGMEGFLYKISISTIPVNGALDMGLADAIRATPISQEWDAQNWIDDVLKTLQAGWPQHIQEVDVTYGVNQLVDIICRAPSR